MLGNKFQQKYMNQVAMDNGEWKWVMKDNNEVVIDGV